MIEPTWQQGDVALYLGDCLEILPQLEAGSVDAVITDPPYGIEMDEGFEGFGGFGKPIARRQYVGGWDDKRPSRECFELLLSISNVALIFGGNHFADILPQGNHWVVWDKLNTMPSFGDCELIWTNIDRKSVKKYTRQWNGLLGKEKKRQHPNQKPVSLLKWLIENYSEPGALILDPYMGSGTTGVASIQTGRPFIGVELREDYFDIAVKRISQAQLQMRMPI